MKRHILTIPCFLIAVAAAAQPPIEWQLSMGGSAFDYGRAIQETSDGGYIVTGYTASTSGDVTGNHGQHDFWVVKLSASRSLQWQKALGGTTDDYSYAVQQTADGGYIVAGHSNSSNGDVTGGHGVDDFWIVKLSSSGAIEWQKALGGIFTDQAWSVQQTADGGYIAAGRTNSTDGDVSGINGLTDFWVVKLSSTGTLSWQKCLGGTNTDYAYSIQQTADGGYIVAGASNSNNNDVSGNKGGYDYWVVKISSTGTLTWQKTLGGSGNEYAQSVSQTADGGYIVAGYTTSSNGDVTGFKGTEDYWVVKLSGSGTLEWQKTLGGSSADQAYAVRQTADGGYIVGGLTESTDGDVTGHHGGYDFWVVKLNSTGTLQWQKALGGSAYDYCYDVRQAGDGGYLLAGYSNSNNGDLTSNKGGHDYWLVKLSAPVGTDETAQADAGLKVYPNPFADEATMEIRNSTVSVQSLKIYSLGGELMRQETVNGGAAITIRRGGLAPGMYFVEAIGEGGVAGRVKIALY